MKLFIFIPSSFLSGKCFYTTTISREITLNVPSDKKNNSEKKFCNLTFISLTFVLCRFSTHFQHYYSLCNESKSSKIILNFYLEKSYSSLEKKENDQFVKKLSIASVFKAFEFCLKVDKTILPEEVNNIR